MCPNWYTTYVPKLVYHLSNRPKISKEIETCPVK